MGDGPGRRRAWRAATRAAREARETERVAGGGREKWKQGTTEIALACKFNDNSSSNGRGDAAPVARASCSSPT